MKTRSALVALAIAGAVVTTHVHAATLLPNGQQTFLDQNGQPLAGGCVSFFIPGTNTTKDTFSDPSGTTLNTNPVQLDAAGRAVIYGVGVYRQVVKAAPCGVLGLQIWDQLTSDTSSTNTIFAGASSGTPNSITVTAPGFTGVNGQIINFVSTNTNTAAATLNPSGFGAVQIVRDNQTGPGPLTGGELVATNAVSVIYDATAGTFHILSPVTWPNTSGVPVGSVIAVAGFTAPTNFAFANGQAVNRATFASLFSAITSAQTGSISSGSPIITGLSDTSQFGRGMPVEAIGIPAATIVLSCTSTTCTMSANATTTRSGTMTFFAYGNGDGSTTFNLPDYSGMTLVARDNLSGSARNISQVSTTITTTNASASATVGSASGLAIGMTIVSTNVPSGTTISDISGTTITMSANATATATAIAARFSIFGDAQALGASVSNATTTLATGNLPPYTPAGTIVNVVNSDSAAKSGGSNTFVPPGGLTAVLFNGLSTVTVSSTFNGNAQGGKSIPISIIQPSRNVNYAIRLVP